MSDPGAPVALFLSPHLDDAAFSCGGTVALLADAGWRCVVATAFTASVPNPAGFALACQLDKGLGPEVDYMALRRDEDRAACALLGAEPRWLSLPEAPHRGYNSAPALFGPVRPADDIWRALVDEVAALLAELRPRRVYAPQGLGGHVDHHQVIRAVLDQAEPARLRFWRDAPYIIRDPAAQPDPAVPAGAPERVDITAGLERKVAASCAYGSQVGFQFGGAAACAEAMLALAWREGGDVPAERFTLGDQPAAS